MAGPISSFLSSLSTDLARPNRFDVFIPVISSLIQWQSDLSLRCESTTLPSRTFATAEQKFGSNPIEKYPYQTTYNDIDMTFIISGDMKEKEFFDAWMEVINPTDRFNFAYKNTYSTEIYVKQYDVTNNLKYSIVLHEAYPIAVNQLDLDWNSQDYHKLIVVFAYTYWEINNTSI
jgi:hypothetical protein